MSTPENEETESDVIREYTDCLIAQSESLANAQKASARLLAVTSEETQLSEMEFMDLGLARSVLSVNRDSYSSFMDDALLQLTDKKPSLEAVLHSLKAIANESDQNQRLLISAGGIDKVAHEVLRLTEMNDEQRGQYIQQELGKFDEALNELDALIQQNPAVAQNLARQMGSTEPRVCRIAPPSATETKLRCRAIRLKAGVTR